MADLTEKMSDLTTGEPPAGGFTFSLVGSFQHSFLAAAISTLTILDHGSRGCRRGGDRLSEKTRQEEARQGQQEKGAPLSEHALEALRRTVCIRMLAILGWCC